LCCPPPALWGHTCAPGRPFLGSTSVAASHGLGSLLSTVLFPVSFSVLFSVCLTFPQMFGCHLLLPWWWWHPTWWQMSLRYIDQILGCFSKCILSTPCSAWLCAHCPTSWWEEWVGFPSSIALSVSPAPCSFLSFLPTPSVYPVSLPVVTSPT
jgi:hypothetical protein